MLQDVDVDAFHPINHWSPTDWACAFAGEVGEACNLIKKRRRGEDIPTQDIAYEIADAIIYADLLAARLGISLEDAVREKFNIVSDRVGSNRHWIVLIVPNIEDGHTDRCTSHPLPNDNPHFDM